MLKLHHAAHALAIECRHEKVEKEMEYCEALIFDLLNRVD